MRKRGINYFSNSLQEEFKFIKKQRLIDSKTSDVICTICGSKFSIANLGRTAICRHLERKVHTDAESDSVTEIRDPELFGDSDVTGNNSADKKQILCLGKMRMKKTKKLSKIKKCILCGTDMTMFTNFCSKDKENVSLLLSWTKSCATSLCKTLNLNPQLNESCKAAKYCDACTQIIRDIDFLVNTQERLRRDLDKKSQSILSIVESNWCQVSENSSGGPEVGSYEYVVKAIYEGALKRCSGAEPVQIPDLQATVKEENDEDERIRFSKSGRELRYLYSPDREEEEEAPAPAEADSDDNFNFGDIKGETVDSSEESNESEVDDDDDEDLNPIEPETQSDDSEEFGGERKQHSKELTPKQKRKPIRKCTFKGCNFKYYKEEGLSIHIRKVHKGDKKPLHCKLCDKKYASRNAFYYHQKSHAGEVSTCPICARTYNDPHDFRLHRLKCTEATPYPASGKLKADEVVAQCSFEECDFRSYKLEMMAHVRTIHLGEKNPYECDVCKTEFSSESGYRSHMRKHNERPRFTCEVCSKGFWSRGELKKHLKRRHFVEDSQNLKFSCEACFKLFTTEECRNIHEELHKTTEHPFTCVICSTIFTSFIDLKNHVNREHETGIPRCPKCLKTFKTPKTLETHVCGQKQMNLNCRNCGFIGQSLRELTQHRLDEHGSNFICQICGKLYLCKYSLRKHMRLHTGDLHLQCRLCPKVFNTHSKWKGHEQTHSTIISAFCDRCGKGFKCNKYLKQHIRSCIGKSKPKGNAATAAGSAAAATATIPSFSNQQYYTTYEQEYIALQAIPR